MLVLMPDLPGIAWIVIGLITFGAAVAVLHALGARVRDEQELESLRLKATKLRSQYRRRLAEAEVVKVVDEGVGAPKARHTRLAA